MNPRIVRCDGCDENYEYKDGGDGGDNLDGQRFCPGCVSLAHWGFPPHLSAPGYTDCTEWIVFPNKSQATRYLENEYGEEES